ncbi:MAG: hypothetical protein ACREMM_09435 [Gemmatimonadales bacterium]
MTRLSFLGLTAMLLIACDDTTTAPPPVPGTPSFSAVTTTDNFTIPISLFVFVPCANGGLGELINVSGPLHVLLHTTISESGNIHMKFHFQPQGISGTGFATGDKYQGTGVTQGQFCSNGPLPLTSTFVNNFRMIGQGPGNNFLVHENFHFTINANGELTAFVDNFSIQCK